MQFKFEVGKTYNVYYPAAPFPYSATFVAVGQEDDSCLFFEFVLNKEHIRISLDDLNKGKLLVESIQLKKDAEKIDWLRVAMEDSSKLIKIQAQQLAEETQLKKDKITVYPDRYLHTAKEAAIKMKHIS